MKFKTWRFRPGPALTLLLGALALAFLLLGNWQGSRAEEKIQAQAAFDAAPMVSALTEDLAPWTRIELEGRLDARRHLLLDNKLHHGRAGVHVLTPFTTAGGSVVLVNRGWLPLPPDRATLPDVPTPAGTVRLEGRLAPLSRPGVELGQPAELHGEDWPKLLVYPDWARLEGAVGQALHRQVMMLDPNSVAGFEGRDWMPFTMGPDRHRAYAVQWYGLSLTAVGAWLVLGLNAGRKSVT